MTSFLNLSGRRRVELVRQAEIAECGLASLAMIAGYHGGQTDIATLRRRFDVSMQGMSLRTLIGMASAIGLAARPIRCDLKELRAIQLPAILHWGGNHFVVLERFNRRHCIVHDPAVGTQRLPWSIVSTKFTGIALELTPNPQFVPRRVRNPLRLSSLLRLTPDVIKALAQSLCLSIVIELLLLATPFYLQLAIDDAMVRGDAEFMTVLATAFAAVLIFRVVATTVRALTLQFVSQVMSFDMQSRVFHHMLRLPLKWFHKRHVGDIQSRFGAIQPIKGFFANGAIAGLLDGVLASLVLVLMFLYSVSLTFLVLVSIGLYLSIRVGSLQLQRRVAGDAIVTQALEQSRFLESLRAIQTVKAVGAEVLRESQQRNAIAASINASIRSGNVQIVYNLAAQIIDGLTEILVVYVGAKAVIGNHMTLGMLTAFLAYKQQFCGRLTNLIEQFVTWRLLGIDLERLSDIALSPAEKNSTLTGYSAPIAGAIQCKSLSFTYSFDEPAVLVGLNVEIEQGEFVAIAGPSGCGKSTLIKLLTGLYEPNEGQVLVDGRRLSSWDRDSLRRQVALVTQDDNLLAGSIAENISLFDEQIDMKLLVSCAQLAQIYADIVAMPMGFDTLVGDLGSSLSGGQKQRVLIARALYRRPRVLIMDEGTSHLDLANEKAINEALRQLKMTRIVVAHRPETIMAADRRLIMQGGKIVSDDKARTLEPVS